MGQLKSNKEVKPQRFTVSHIIQHLFTQEENQCFEALYAQAF